MAKRRSTNITNELAKKVAYEYSKLAPQYAQGFFCAKYQLTVSTFHKLLKKAITECLVDDDTCLKIREKAVRNSLNYGNKKHAEDCKTKYYLLFKERETYEKENGLRVSNLSRHYDVDYAAFTSKTLSCPTLYEKDLLALISKYEHMLDSYDYFFIEEEGAPSREEISATLAMYKCKLRSVRKNNKSLSHH